MARPRAFDPEMVLNAARDLFWSRGYRAVSLDDVTEATGVNKPSLYAAFGDKTQLFLAILDRYHGFLEAHAEKTLASSPSAKAGLRAWLFSLLPFCWGPNATRGCLSVNTALEAGALDPEVRNRIEAHQQRIEALLKAAFERGRKAGELSKSLDAAGAAAMLYATQTGLMVLARSKPSEKKTRAVMEGALAGLGL